MTYMAPEVCPVCRRSNHNPLTKPCRDDDSELAALRETVALMEGTLDSRDRNIAGLIAVNKDVMRENAALRTKLEEAERKLAKTEMTRLNNALFTEQWERLCAILSIEKCSVIEAVDTVERRLKETEQEAAYWKEVQALDAHAAKTQIQAVRREGMEEARAIATAEISKYSGNEACAVYVSNVIRAKIGEQK